jgi:hypothetical protein
MAIQFSGTAGAVTVSELNPDIVSKPSLSGCSFTTAVGSNIVIADSANLNPGKNNFSIGPIRLYVQNNGQTALVDKLSTNDGYKLVLTATTGILSLVVGTGADTVTATCDIPIPGFVAGLNIVPMAEIVVTVSRSATEATVKFYAYGEQLGGDQTIALAESIVVTSTADVTIFNRMAWSIFAPMMPLWNYALSATDINKIFMTGATGFLSGELTFKWGSMTNTTNTENSTFVGGTVGNWAVVDSTVAVVSNELEWTLPASSAVVSYLQCNQTPSQFANGYYNVRFNYKLSSGTAVPLTLSRAGSDTYGTITPTGDWQTFTAQFYASGGGAIKIATASAAANGSVYLFDNFETTKAGCICEYDGNPHGYQWHDQSTNKLHATLGLYAYAINNNPSNILRYSSSTSGTEFVLGSDRVCLPTNHVITSIYAYTAGTPTVDIGTAASAADIAGSQVLVAGWNEIALLNRQSSTYKLNVTSSSADAIVWNINYTILLP